MNSSHEITGQRRKRLTLKFKHKFRDGTADADIHEHMDTLHDLVLKTNARVALELGTKLGNSTLAMAEAVKLTRGLLVSIDIDPCSIAHARVSNYGLTDYWSFIHADDMDVDWTEPLDMLFIDSSHDEKHTYEEIVKYSSFVRPRGVIALHDTRSFPGVWRAIQKFLDDYYGRFVVEAHYENNHGLCVLRATR